MRQKLIQNQPVPTRQPFSLMPPAWKPYATLMRLDKPAGTWLLLLPCWWGVALASRSDVDLWLLAVFAFGSLLMRGAGCIINDIWDRDFDRKVERTKDRPLASGVLTVRQALFFLCGVMSVAATLLVYLNLYTVLLILASLVLVVLYPLAKRVTWAPQFVLGLAFNWGALAGTSAVQGTIQMSSLLLYAGGVFWTLGYDTIYAHQDKRDDVAAGVKSLALWLGDSSRTAIACFYALALAFIASAGFVSDKGAAFYGLLIVAALHAAWQIGGWRMDDPNNCALRFRSNRDFGLIIWAALMAGSL